MPQKKGKNERDSRYQLTRRLMEVIQPLGYEGMIILLDRIDEPTLVAGDAERMQAILWPMFDNKFLKQERIGLKMLLPIELRHQLHRESPKFFQTARLDKQNMVDRLSWSGATLYDLCNNRLRACSDPADGDSPLALTDLFEADVTPDLLIDALDQMHQPRDAFKFLYAVIQEHCRITPEDRAKHKIARLTLESIRRDQAQRVQEFYRGLTPLDLACLPRKPLCIGPATVGHFLRGFSNAGRWMTIRMRVQTAALVFCDSSRSLPAPVASQNRDPNKARWSYNPFGRFPRQNARDKFIVGSVLT